MTTPHTRRCTGCNADQPMSAYTVRKRDADGAPTRWYSRCRKCRHRSWRPKDQRVPRDYVPVGPFSEWINERKEHYGGLERLALACGKSSARQLRRVLSESRFVSIYVVDEWVTPEGSARLEELYPLEDEAVAA